MQAKSANAKPNEEIIIRKTRTQEGEVIVIEWKQQPLRIDGFEL